MELVAFSPRNHVKVIIGGNNMTILTGTLIYVGGMIAFLLFFRHVRSCDENMRAAFLESLATKQGSPKASSIPVIHRAS